MIKYESLTSIMLLRINLKTYLDPASSMRDCASHVSHVASFRKLLESLRCLNTMKYCGYQIYPPDHEVLN